MPKHLWFAVAAAGFFAASVALQAANPQVLLKTSKGDITVELFQDKAPISVKNFLSYVDDKHYEGTIFHRVIKGFMVQGGGMTADMNEKSAKPPIKNEAANGLKNKRGTLAMARTPEIDSATSQFFINLVDNSFLDHQQGAPDKFGYAVFGKVVAGMDVVDAIAAVPTGSKGMHQDVPREPLTIVSVTLVEGK
ncbi:MAG TPA: peptidylprolyl isomerase [Acidobacteriota bacterium]|nr:peptidylprolyl isomerase [Acidobacteriota bacterium]